MLPQTWLFKVQWLRFQYSPVLRRTEVNIRASGIGRTLTLGSRSINWIWSRSLPLTFSCNEYLKMRLMEKYQPEYEPLCVHLGGRGELENDEDDP